MAQTKTDYLAAKLQLQPPATVVNIPITVVPPAGRTGKPGPQPPRPSNTAPTRAPR
jgi:hypothetical protein